MYRLYDFHTSGNGYKVRLLLTQLGVPFEYTEVDVVKKETRRPEFLAINPNGRIPVLVADEGKTLTESNAILFFLAEGTDYLPEDPFDKARVLEWMFYEQYSHEPFIATSRYWLTCSGTPELFTEKIAEKREGGLVALELMNNYLENRNFLVAERYTIADIALYAYTHVAHEGNFDLSGYSHINRWLANVAAQEKHIPITFKPGVD